MRRSPVNAAIAPIKTSAITGDARSNSMVSWTRGRYIWSNCTLNVFIGSKYPTSQLVTPVEPFGQLAFTDTPLATDLESGQLFAGYHTHRGSPGYLQQNGGLAESQKTQRINVVFHQAS
jgi:hypothetical protein